MRGETQGLKRRRSGASLLVPRSSSSLVFSLALIFAVTTPCSVAFGTLARLSPSLSPASFIFPRKSMLAFSPVRLSSARQDEHDEVSKVFGTVTILIPSTGSDTPSKFTYQPSKEDPISLGDAVLKISEQASYLSDGGVEVSIVPVPISSSADNEKELVQRMAVDADILLGLSLVTPYDVRYLSTLFRDRRLLVRGKSGGPSRGCQFALGCAKPFAPIVGAHDEANPSLLMKFPFTKESADRELMYQMMFLFERWTVEDFADALLLFLRGS